MLAQIFLAYYAHWKPQSEYSYFFYWHILVIVFLKTSLFRNNIFSVFNVFLIRVEIRDLWNVFNNGLFKINSNTMLWLKSFVIIPLCMFFHHFWIKSPKCTQLQTNYEFQEFPRLLNVNHWTVFVWLDFIDFDKNAVLNFNQDSSSRKFALPLKFKNNTQDKVRLVWITWPIFQTSISQDRL